MLGGLINGLLNAVISLILALVNMILLPIDAVISAALPSLSSALGSVGGLFDYLITTIAYVLDFSLLSDTAISLIVAYFTFMLTIPIAFSSIKLALKWYATLKL